MSKNLSKKKILKFEDNNLMQIMCGAYHSNLDVIEKQLDVSLLPRGNLISILGKSENILITKNTLSKLYERAKSVKILEEKDVEAIINFMKEHGKNNKKQSNDYKNYYIKVPKCTIFPRSKGQENLIKQIYKIGEKITIKRCNFFDDNKYMNFSYVHAALKKNIGKLGVVVCIESKKFNKQIKDFGHKLAMHIAASNPLTIEVSQLDKKMLEKENEIIGEELRNSSKEAKIIEKISKGKFEKFKQENTLINQIWIMDPKKKVKDVIAELGKENSITIKDFVRYKVGE